MNYKPVVLSSKMAEEHLNDVKVKHADILMGIQNQQMKVQQYKQEQDIMRQQKEQVGMEKEKMNMENQQKTLEQINKQKELDIKASALAMP